MTSLAVQPQVHKLEPALDSCFLVNVGDVLFDCLGRDVDLGRDIPIALSAEDEPRDLRFTRRQSEMFDDAVPVIGRRSEPPGGRGPLQHSPQDDYSRDVRGQPQESGKAQLEEPASPEVDGPPNAHPEQDQAYGCRGRE